MFFKCPRCKEHKVLETTLEYMTWKRYCQACGFVYTLKAVETAWEPPQEGRLFYDLAPATVG